MAWLLAGAESRISDYVGACIRRLPNSGMKLAAASDKIAEQPVVHRSDPQTS